MKARLSFRPRLNLSVPLPLPLFLSLCLVLMALPASASARTRTEVALGDPDIGDQGPAPVPPKALKASSLRLNRPNHIPPDRWRMLIDIALALGLRTL